MTSRTSARRKRREQYEKVLRIVEYQSGGKQPALARRSSIIMVAKQSGLDAEITKKRLRAAHENGDVICIRDRVVRASEETLREAIGELNGDISRLASALEEDEDG